MTLGRNPLDTMPAPPPPRSVNQSALIDIGRVTDFSSYTMQPQKRSDVLNRQKHLADPQRQYQAALNAQPFFARLTGPTKFMKQIAERWQLDDSDAARLFGLQDAGEFKAVIDGLITLTARPDVRERVRLAIEIRSKLGRYLQENIDAERSWINEFKSSQLEATPRAMIHSGRLTNLYSIHHAIAAYFGR